MVCNSLQILLMWNAFMPMFECMLGIDFEMEESFWLHGISQCHAEVLMLLAYSGWAV
jgi:hypothetical protein